MPSYRQERKKAAPKTRPTPSKPAAAAKRKADASPKSSPTKHPKTDALRDISDDEDDGVDRSAVANGDAPETEIPDTRSLHQVSESDDEPGIERSAESSRRVPEEDADEPEVNPGELDSQNGQFFP